MPEWLLAFCVNTCLIAGTIISLAILAILVIIFSVEIYDFFTEGDDELEEEEDY